MQCTAHAYVLIFQTVLPPPYFREIFHLRATLSSVSFSLAVGKNIVLFQEWEETVWLTISLQLFSPTIHILVERLNCLKINSEGNLFYSESMRKINIKYFFFCFSFKYLLYWIFFSFFFFGANFSVVLYTEHAFSAVHQRTILIPYILYQTTFLSWTKWNSIFHGQRIGKWSQGWYRFE